MVYHRLNPSTNLLNVYYRRSIPYSETNPTIAGITWENEINLTGDGILKLDSITRYLNCGYPSLTIRTDTSDALNPKVNVYVVYACIDNPDIYKIRISENVFSTEGAQMVFPAREIDSTKGIRYLGSNWLDDDSYLSTWGAPTINASALGNYYAWADSTRGIVARWKKPQDVNFSQELLLLWVESMGCMLKMKLYT